MPNNIILLQKENLPKHLQITIYSLQLLCSLKSQKENERSLLALTLNFNTICFLKVKSIENLLNTSEDIHKTHILNNQK